MSYMKRDYGSEHDRGGLSLGGGSQPNEPALGREFDTPKAPPTSPYGPRICRPRNNAFSARWNLELFFLDPVGIIVFKVDIGV